MCVSGKYTRNLNQSVLFFFLSVFLFQNKNTKKSTSIDSWFLIRLNITNWYLHLFWFWFRGKGLEFYCLRIRKRKNPRKTCYTWKVWYCLATTIYTHSFNGFSFLCPLLCLASKSRNEQKNRSAKRAPHKLAIWDIRWYLTHYIYYLSINVMFTHCTTLLCIYLLATPTYCIALKWL